MNTRRVSILSGFVLLATSCSGEDPAVPTSLLVSPSNASAEVGGTRNFTAQILDQRGNPYQGAVIWNSANVSIASVDASGTAQGLAPGDVLIQAIHEGVVGAALLTVTDHTAPTVSVLNPLPASTVAGVITVRAEASDNHRIAYLALVVDGASTDTLRAKPWEFSWNTRAVTNAIHSIRVVAADPSGNETTSSAITVTVSNGTIVRVRNYLPTRIFTTLNGASGWVSADSYYDFSTVVAAGGVINLSWEAEKPTNSAGTALGERFAGVFGSVTPDDTMEVFYVDNELAQSTFYFATITNGSSAVMWPAVNAGTTDEYRCPCSIPAGMQGAWIGYYKLYQWSNVAVYNSAKGYFGPYLYYNVTAANIPSPSGKVLFTFSAAPMAPELANTGRRPAQGTDRSPREDRFLTTPLLTYDPEGRARPIGSSR